MGFFVRAKSNALLTLVLWPMHWRSQDTFKARFAVAYPISKNISSVRSPRILPDSKRYRFRRIYYRAPRISYHTHHRKSGRCSHAGTFATPSIGMLRLLDQGAIDGRPQKLE